MTSLYVVATPIGNLEDITLRALRILKEVDLVACEDTRRTRILLDHYEITTTTVSYHQHSKLQKLDFLLDQLEAGKSIALVSDAGTPGINDPGGLLVRRARAAGINIIPIPGPNAGVTLLSASGWPADQYLFLGYLPKKKGRQTLLKKLEDSDRKVTEIVVVYESPHRLVRTLEDFQAIFPNGSVTIGRELTKQFEEIWQGTLTDALEQWSPRMIKGELVLVIHS